MRTQVEKISRGLMHGQGNVPGSTHVTDCLTASAMEITGVAPSAPWLSSRFACLPGQRKEYFHMREIEERGQHSVLQANSCLSCTSRRSHVQGQLH